ncbi:MAG: ATP-binding protein [Flavobacteriales bacterium]
MKLKQILLNLLSNALKFTKEGSITLNAECLLKSDRSCVLKFEVKDTGIGIAEDKKESVFQSFTQASSATTRKYGGTGLGLTIVKKMVDLQGGKIELQSTLGSGSSFIIHLPYGIDENSALNEKHKSEEISLPSNFSILLVEDNAFNQMVAVDTLKDWNSAIKIDIADDGVKALDKLKSNSYDLIIMDIQMPEMDGHDTSNFCVQLR